MQQTISRRAGALQDRGSGTPPVSLTDAITRPIRSSFNSGAPIVRTEFLEFRSENSLARLRRWLKSPAADRKTRDLRPGPLMYDGAGTRARAEPSL
jgi:hypothetical protein